MPPVIADKPAFSLLELVIAITIIAISAGALMRVLSANSALDLSEISKASNQAKSVISVATSAPSLECASNICKASLPNCPKIGDKAPFYHCNFIVSKPAFDSVDCTVLGCE